ncbi:MAG: thioesterase domain-containing protein [Clostridia bacterium]|nr:thioesterase domain-containing protein [Clostridia bacterium]
MEKMILFCFPYVGGSSTVYNKWKAFVDNCIELVPVEYSGRGKRIREHFYDNMSEAIDDMYKTVSSFIEGRRFAVYGHSMGSVIAYEICKRIKMESGKDPLHIFVSGRYPPHVKKDEELLHMLPDDRFKEEILKIGGTPGEVFENREFAQIFIPILRADYRLIERYEYVEENVRFNCGITVLNGNADKITSGCDMFEWQKHTAHKIVISEFNGGHFFIHDYIKEITGIINSTLTECTLRENVVQINT